MQHYFSSLSGRYRYISSHSLSFSVHFKRLQSLMQAPGVYFAVLWSMIRHVLSPDFHQILRLPYANLLLEM
jgi:hypothetical protein